jgi:hypothetical protein
MNIEKIFFNLFALTQILLVIIFYYYWSNELLYVINSPMPVNFRDPSVSFSYNGELLISVFFSTFLLAGLHFVNNPIKNKIKMNKGLLLTSIASVLIIYGNLVSFLVFHNNYPSFNPFTAFIWFMD